MSIHRLILFLILGAGLVADTSEFTVETLPEAEVAALETAREEIRTAARKLAAIEDRIRRRLGDTEFALLVNAGCTQETRRVELRGKWALITDKSVYVCGSTSGTLIDQMSGTVAR